MKNNKEIITKFILEEKKKGKTKLNIFDISLATQINSDEVEKIMKGFEGEKRVKRIEAKEIKTKETKDLIFRCDCKHPGFVCFDYDKEFGVFVEVIDEPTYLLYRIKNALHYIFKGGKLYYIDIILGKEDIKKLSRFLDDIKK